MSSVNELLIAAARKRVSTNTPSMGAQTILHLDGNVTDTGSNPKIWTVGSIVTSDAANFKFGSGSYNFSNFTAYPAGISYAISTPATADFQFGAGDFTIDCWISPTATIGFIFGQARFVIAGDASVAMNCNSTGHVKFNYQNNSGVDFSTGWSTGVIAIGSWGHVAVCRSGAFIYLFINGALEVTHNIGAGTIINVPASTPDFAVGGPSAGANQAAFGGHVDEFRLIKGLAVWTSAFTPPTAPYI